MWSRALVSFLRRFAGPSRAFRTSHVRTLFLLLWRDLCRRLPGRYRIATHRVLKSGAPLDFKRHLGEESTLLFCQAHQGQVDQAGLLATPKPFRRTIARRQSGFILVRGKIRMSKVVILSVHLAAFVSLSLLINFAATARAQYAKKEAKPAPQSRTAMPKLTPEQERGLRLLKSLEVESAGLEPNMHAFVLWQASYAYTKVDLSMPRSCRALHLWRHRGLKMLQRTMAARHRAVAAI
jgi:hypothetical protein